MRQCCIFCFHDFFKNLFQILLDADTAQEAYKNVVEYFGESPKTMPPETFFPMVDRFIKAFQKAEKDLSEWQIADVSKVLIIWEIR